MRWRVSSFASILGMTVAGCGGDDGGGGMPGGTGAGGDEIPGMVSAHNAVRDTVGVPHVTWDDAVSAVAQDWADACNWMHSSNGYGENLYAATGSSTAQDVVDTWASEVAFYDYDSNSCAPDEDCGHYTQVVWRDTERIGCAFAMCPASTSPFGPEFGDWEFWVCNYDPPGNWGGEKPY